MVRMMGWNGDGDRWGRGGIDWLRVRVRVWRCVGGSRGEGGLVSRAMCEDRRGEGEDGRWGSFLFWWVCKIKYCDEEM